MFKTFHSINHHYIIQPKQYLIMGKSLKITIHLWFPQFLVPVNDPWSNRWILVATKKSNGLSDVCQSPITQKTTVFPPYLQKLLSTVTSEQQGSSLRNPSWTCHKNESMPQIFLLNKKTCKDWTLCYVWTCTYVCLSVSLSVRTYVHMYVCTYTYMHESQVSFMQPNEILVSSKFLSAGPIPVLPARPNSLLRPSIQQWNCSIFLKPPKNR